jgi:hypothetical protein
MLRVLLEQSWLPLLPHCHSSLPPPSIDVGKKLRYDLNLD